ncbi:MAG: lipoyl(octanoyl) transferase LipB [Planctomycetota bacterium]
MSGLKFSRSRDFEILDLGRCEYEEANRKMLSAVEERTRGAIPDRLLFCEFEPVVTVGRGGDPARYRRLGLPVIPVARGGKATFHGPGQVVAYPILALEGKARDLHAFLRAFEEALILTVGDFGLKGARDPRNTGCWVNGRKIASIGVAVRRWVTYHGVALNVATDLAFFRRFDPCGLDPELVTSMVRELKEPPSLDEVRSSLARRFQEVLRS